MMTDPHVGQRFSTDQGTLVFTVSEIRQRTIHFAATGDTEPRRINRERWEELFAEGTLREVHRERPLQARGNEPPQFVEFVR